MYHERERRVSIHVMSEGVEHSLTMRDQNLGSFEDIMQSLLPLFGSLGFKVSMTTDASGAVLIVPTGLEDEYDDFFDVTDDTEDDDFPAEAEEAFNDYWDRAVDEAASYFAEWEPKVGEVVRYVGGGTPDEIRGHGGYTDKPLTGKLGIVEESGKAFGTPNRYRIKFFDWADGWGDKKNEWWVEADNLSKAD